MQAKAIPAPGSWGTKKTKPDEAAVLFRVESVDPVKEQFTVERFAGFDGATPLFGRQSTISFATWQTGRYQPCDPPAAPVPEMLDRQEAEARLSSPPNGLMPPTAEQIATMLSSPRAAIADMVSMFRADSLTDDAIDSDWEMVILRAHVRWLDAQGALPVEVFVSPEPVSDVVLTSQAEIADLKAEIAACRAEVAGLRADFRALMKAIEAGGQLRLFPVAA